jgi:nicotinate-nucleotide--dimethylbenzimidazole phosphoribosyltransferase
MSLSSSPAFSGLPFDSIRELVATMPQADAEVLSALQKRAARLADVYGSMGVTAQYALWAGAWQWKERPAMSRPLLALFSSTHAGEGGLGEEDLLHVTRARLELVAAGGAPVNQICASHSFGLKVFDLALEHPTASIIEDEALDEAACTATIAFGMEAIAGGLDLLMLSDLSVSGGLSVRAMAGALLDEAHEARQDERVAEALATHAGQLGDPLEVLRRLGGRDVCALMGAIVAARHERIPVILEGEAALCAALVLWTMRDDAVAHCILAQRPPESWLSPVVAALDLPVVVDAHMGTGDGSAAALAGVLVRAGVTCFDDTVVDV